MKEYFGVPRPGTGNDIDFPIATPKPVPGQMMKKPAEVVPYPGNLADMCIPEFLAELTTGCKFPLPTCLHVRVRDPHHIVTVI